MNRLKDRSLFHKGVPESQEAEVMNLELANRPFDPSGIKSKRYKSSEPQSAQMHHRPPMGHPGQYPQQYPQQFPQQHLQQFPQQFPPQFPQQFPQQFPPQFPQQHPQQFPQQLPQQYQQQQMLNNMYQRDRSLPQMPSSMPMMPIQGNPPPPNMHPHLSQQPVPQPIPLSANPPQHPPALASNTPVPVMMNGNPNGFAHQGMQSMPMQMSGPPPPMSIPNPTMSAPPLQSPIPPSNGTSTPPAPHQHYLNMMGPQSAPMNNMIQQQQQIHTPPAMPQLNPELLQLLNKDSSKWINMFFIYFVIYEAKLLIFFIINNFSTIT